MYIYNIYFFGLKRTYIVLNKGRRKRDRNIRIFSLGKLSIALGTYTHWYDIYLRMSYLYFTRQAMLFDRMIFVEVILRCYDLIHIQLLAVKLPNRGSFCTFIFTFLSSFFLEALFISVQHSS